MELEPQELDDAGVAVGQVEVHERPVADGADELAVSRALEQRAELRVAVGELGGEVRLRQPSTSPALSVVSNVRATRCTWSFTDDVRHAAKAR